MLDKLFEDLIGIPYLRHGRDPKVGLDCYGVVRITSERMGYVSPDYGNPTNDPSFLTAMKSSEQVKELYETLEKPVPGCLVTFCIIPPYSTHIGVVLDDCNQFLHVMRDKNVCIERLNSLRWKDKVTGYYKWTKLL